MASSNLLFESTGQLLLEDGSLFQLTAEFDEPDPVPEVAQYITFGGLRQIRKQAIPISIRVKIHSKLHVKNTTTLSILSRVFIPSILKIPIISSLLSIPLTQLKLSSKLQVKQKESVSIKGKQSYAEFYKTVQQLEEMMA